MNDYQRRALHLLKPKHLIIAIGPEELAALVAKVGPKPVAAWQRARRCDLCRHTSKN